VANVISLDNKLQLSKDKKAALIQKRKILAVRKVFQCTQCAFKCEKCGTQLGLDNPGRENDNRNLRIPYRFCESCSEEYIDYIDRLQGRGDPDRYWHNDAWLSVWRRWIDFQSANDSYLKSKEFTRLLQELKQTWPDEPDGSDGSDDPDDPGE